MTIIRHTRTSWNTGHLFLAIYRVAKWYRVKERNYIRDNFEKLHSSHAFLFLNYLLIKSDKD